MQVAYLDVFRAGLEFAVERPIHVSGGGDAQMGCFEETEQLVIVILALQGDGGGDELADVLRLAHEHDFKLAIVQVDLSGVEPQHAAHGGGVARHAEDELAGAHFPLRLHGDGVGADVGEVLDAFKDVGEVADGVLDRLRGGVGGAGEGAERRPCRQSSGH